MKIPDEKSVIYQVYVYDKYDRICLDLMTYDKNLAQRRVLELRHQGKTAHYKVKRETHGL